MELLRMDNYQVDMTKDALFRGEFEVVKDLLAAFPDGEASKRECDKVSLRLNVKCIDYQLLLTIHFFQVIDKNGPPPKGTGIKQLRENIAESKLSYEIMDDAAQVKYLPLLMYAIRRCFPGLWKTLK